MQRRKKLRLLLILTSAVGIITFLFHPVAQSPAYNDFADKRSLIGLANFANVISNLPFIGVGAWGLLLLYRTRIPGAIFAMYLLLFLGIFLTGFGSSYYHSYPDNNTLVWDRIPMTLVFMALTAATVAELIDLQLGTRLLIPLILLGIASVWWWHYTELQGRGDLRLYGFVQFYPMIFLPLVLWFFYDPLHNAALKCLAWVVVWYVLAKLLELWDKPIYAAMGISGHTLKHLAAAVSAGYLVVLFKRKYMSVPSKETVSIR